MSSKKIILILAVFLVLIGAINLSCAKRQYPYRQLTGQQKQQAEDWIHSANMLYEIGDYDLALDYYRKIVKYYPGTKYSEEAIKGIDKIEK
jgi:outer membrane protein assembly factor BamD (BamD/ComL family)